MVEERLIPTAQERREFMKLLVGMAASGWLLPAFGCIGTAAEMDPNLAFLDYQELSRKIREGSVSAERLVRLHLNRIEKASALRAFTFVDSAGALARARELDRLLNQGKMGLLHGLPIVLKDDLEARGMPMSLGSKLTKKWKPATDATSVRRLREAGAVILGKTNLDEFTLGTVGRNSRFGQTVNPFVSSRTPGGSSAGSAVAVASGLAWAALGSEASGSIRLPASACGIVGFKPTMGIVSRKGLTPMVPTKDVVGVLARSVPEVARVMEVLAGGDPEDPTTKGVPVWIAPDFSKASLRGTRIGHLVSYTESAEASVQNVTREALKKLRELGAMVEDVRSEHDELVQEAGDLINAVEFRTWIEVAIRRFRPGVDIELVADELDPVTRALLSRFGKTTGHIYLKHLQQSRGTIIRYYTELHKKYPVLVLPTSPILPPENEQAEAVAQKINDGVKFSGYVFRRNCEISGLTGFPAISVPAGHGPDGVPIGLQLMAGPFMDAKLLEASAVFEGATRFYRRPPAAPS